MRSDAIWHVSQICRGSSLIVKYPLGLEEALEACANLEVKKTWQRETSSRFPHHMLHRTVSTSVIHPPTDEDPCPARMIKYHDLAATDKSHWSLRSFDGITCMNNTVIGLILDATLSNTTALLMHHYDCYGSKDAWTLSTRGKRLQITKVTTPPADPARKARPTSVLPTYLL